MQKSNHICYNTSKYACFKPYNTYTNSMLKYCKKVVKKACNLQFILMQDVIRMCQVMCMAVGV